MAFAIRFGLLYPRPVSAHLAAALGPFTFESRKALPETQVRARDCIRCGPADADAEHADRYSPT